jgi:hypothetical protein
MSSTRTAASSPDGHRGGEMTSVVRQYRCDDGRVGDVQDPSGLVVEDVPPPR